MFREKSGSSALRSLALDAINANVLVIDGQGRIIYLNGAMARLLREIETDIREDLPDFAVGALLGRDIGVLFEDPGRPRRMREKPATHRTTVRVGKQTFDLVETPIASPDGILIGVAIELSDASLRLQNLNYAAQANSIGRVRGVVEFNIDGTIVTANELFLKSTGYSLAEIKGRHHSMFLDPSERDTAAYRNFWTKLSRGEYEAAESKRFGKGGKEIWILAAYNPLLDEKGKPFKVVKIAHDITEQKLQSAELSVR